MATAPDTAEELLGIILELGIPRICKTYRRPPLPTRLLRDLYAIKDQPEALRFIAAYPLSPSDLLEALSCECTDPDALASAAVNPRTPAHLLSRITESPLPAVRSEAARNPQLSSRDMRLLARDIDRNVRLALTSNPALKPQVMAEMARDGEPAVRAALAAHPTLLPEIRFALHDDPSPIVAAELATHGQDEESLLFSADSDDENLQTALLDRRDLPESVGRSLLHSCHPHIRAKARERFTPTLPDRLGIARRGSVEERCWLAREAELPPALQRILSQDEDASVRQELAAHPEVHDDIAAHFITMHDEDCCETLAANPATPADLLLALAQTGIESIPPLLAYRRNLPREVFVYLLQEAPNPDFLRHLAHMGHWPDALLPALLHPFIDHPLPSIRRLVAASTELDAAQRMTLRHDPAPAVRLALCGNPVTSDLELEEMFEDSDPQVAEAAYDRWQSTRRDRSPPSPTPEPASPADDFDESSSAAKASNSSGVLRRIKRIFV